MAKILWYYLFKRYDTTINTNSSQAVIWAVGPVNNKVRNQRLALYIEKILNFSRRFSVNKSFDICTYQHFSKCLIWYKVSCRLAIV